MATDGAFMSSTDLHREDLAEKRYQQRIRERYERILSDDGELDELIDDYLPVLKPALRSLARDDDHDHGHALHNAMNKLAESIAKHLTPSRVDGDYETPDKGSEEESCPRCPAVGTCVRCGRHWS